MLGGMRRRTWLRALAASALGLLACESEAERIEARVNELALELPLRPNEARDARKKRILTELEPALDAAFRIDAPWLGVDTDRDFALASAVSLEQLFPLSDLELESVEVSLSASGKRAWVRGSARASSTQPGDLHAFALRFELDLKKVGTRWQLVSLSLRDPSQPLPEARP